MVSNPADLASHAQAGSTPRHVILGTAGHIDHGKTSLVRALTGTDTDRLPEEKRRGMTIELGFAELRIDDVHFGIVDVPGHERFVRTMVAGATGIDVALVVVAADDSVMPQTVEHVEILDLLGIRNAVVAVTKCDLVDRDTAELVAEEVADLLATTSLSGAPVIHVSSNTGAGLDQLRAALRAAAQNAAARRDDQPFRLAIDRVFSMSGRGTVVTGSVLTGRLRAGEGVEIQPAGRMARARAVQTHNRETDLVAAGQRAAVNLQGIELADVARGDELTAPGIFHPTPWFDAELTCLDSHDTPIRNHARVRVSLGAREVLARCVCLDQPQIVPGGRALVQMRCRQPVVVAHGQRFIVRDENAARTAGGGVVLRAARRRISPRMTGEVAGLALLRDGAPAERLEEAIRYSGLQPLDDVGLELAAGVSRSEIRALREVLTRTGKLCTLPGVDAPLSRRFLEAVQQRAAAWLAARHRENPQEPGTLLETFSGYLERRSHRAFARAVCQAMLDSGVIRALGRYICLREFAPALSAEDERVLADVLTAMHRAAFQPPAPHELADQLSAKRPRVEKLVRLALALGELVPIDASIMLHAERERELRRRLRELYRTDGPFSVSQMRAALDTTRKYAVPFAEYLDRIGFTRREGDQRVIAEPRPSEESA